MDAKETEKTGDVLMRLMLGCLLFRLGGEQTFTPQEIDEIKNSVGGVQVLATDQDTIVLRVRTPESYTDLIDRGAEQW